MPSMFLCILSPLCFCIVIVNLQPQGDVQHGHHHVSVNGRKQPNCSRDLQVESAFGSFHSSWKYFQAGRSRTHKQYWSRWKQVSAKKISVVIFFETGAISSSPWDGRQRETKGLPIYLPSTWYGRLKNIERNICRNIWRNIFSLFTNHP